MRAGIPHVVIRSVVLALLAPALLGGCLPRWSERGPVTGPNLARAAGRCPQVVHVYPGDTLYAVARRCDISVRDLIEANGLSPPYMLSPGTTLRMPGGGTVHVVARGDTLSVLARRYHVDFRTLAQVNGKHPPYTIYVGEKLSIPGGYGTRVASVPAPAGRERVIIDSPNAGPGPGRAPASSPEAARPAASPTATARQPAPPSPQQSQALPPEPAALAGGGFGWPLKGEVLSEFGPAAKGQHNDGLNIAAPQGTSVQAAESGVVVYSGNEIKGFGNLLLIKHADGWMTAYAHNERLLVRKGETVARGQPIATVGATGGVETPQLHFEIRKGTEAVDPRKHLPQGMA